MKGIIQEFKFLGAYQTRKLFDGFLEEIFKDIESTELDVCGGRCSG